MYSVIDLGEEVHPFDINGRGVVCGTFYDKSTFRAFVWTATAGLTAIATEAWSSTAYAINDAGQVAGVLTQEPDSPPRAFRWTPPGTLELLVTPPLSEVSAAFAIASDGRCAGIAESVGEFFTDHRAVLWPNPGLRTSVSLQDAYDMNDHGQIVGRIPATAPGIFWFPKSPPALWQPDAPGATSGTAHALALPPNAVGGVGRTINAIGQVAGTTWGAFGDTRAFLWTPDAPNAVTGSTISLGLLPRPGDPGAYSHAYGINRRGSVVGTSDARAFIYRRGMMEDLNDSITPDSGWVLSEATAINDRGRIVGRGGRYGQPFLRGFLLQPRIPWDEWTKFPNPVWHAWLRRGPLPPPEPEAAPRDHGADPSRATPLAQPASSRIRDVMNALAASELAKTLRDDTDRAALQTAALEAARRSIDRVLRDLQQETGRPKRP